MRRYGPVKHLAVWQRQESYGFYLDGVREVVKTLWDPAALHALRSIVETRHRPLLVKEEAAMKPRDRGEQFRLMRLRIEGARETLQLLESVFSDRQQ